MTNDPFPIRKRQRLQSFDYNTSSRYFLTICTEDKKHILSEIKLGDIMISTHVILTEIGKIVDRYIHSANNMEGITVEHYVIMPNHIHIIVSYICEVGSSKAPTPTNAVIPRFVSTLKRLVNKEIGANIWQRGYYDHVIRGERDYKNAWEYIDANPWRWLEDPYYH